MTVYCASGNESISAAVVRALGAVSNTRPKDVRPLYESIDPEALDDLIRDRDTEGEIRFEHAEYRITAHGSGAVRLEEAMDEPV